MPGCDFARYGRKFCRGRYCHAWFQGPGLPYYLGESFDPGAAYFNGNAARPPLPSVPRGVGGIEEGATSLDAPDLYEPYAYDHSETDTKLQFEMDDDISSVTSASSVGGAVYVAKQEAYFTRG